MANKKDRVTKGLLEIGACWAVRSDRYCGANDPLEAQIAGERTYHIHPDASYPHQDDILMFRNLDEILGYIKAAKASNAAEDDSAAEEIMQDFWDSL